MLILEDEGEKPIIVVCLYDHKIHTHEGSKFWVLHNAFLVLKYADKYIIQSLNYHFSKFFSCHWFYLLISNVLKIIV